MALDVRPSSDAAPRHAAGAQTAVPITLRERGLTDWPDDASETITRLAHGLQDLLWHLGRAIAQWSAERSTAYFSPHIETLLRKFLEIFETVGDRAGIAGCCYHLGNLAYLRGDHDDARRWYRQGLPILQVLGDQAGLARSYHQLGMVAQQQGDHNLAFGWYRQALEISTTLEDRASVARSYHQLGNVAYLREEYDQAHTWYQKSLEIEESLGDRAGIAGCCHQLGITAHRLGHRDQALAWYNRALSIGETLADKVGTARALSQIGILYTETGDVETGLSFNLKSLAIRLGMEGVDPHVNLYWLARQRDILGIARFSETMRQFLNESDVEAVTALLQDKAQPTSRSVERASLNRDR